MGIRTQVLPGPSLTLKPCRRSLMVVGCLLPAEVMVVGSMNFCEKQVEHAEWWK